jgi:flagellar hook capping protein FlgD
VYVDGVDVDAENPRRFNWQHETIAGKSQVRLLAVGGGGGGGGGEFGAKPVVTPLRTMLSSPVETGPGGPFSLRYSIAETNVPVRLGIYDLMGRLVREFDEGMRGPGEYAVTWHADDNADHRVARGLYIVRLEAGSIRASRKVMIWRQ